MVSICIDSMPLANAGENQQICSTTTQLEAEIGVFVGNWELIGGENPSNASVLFQEEKDHIPLLHRR